MKLTGGPYDGDVGRVMEKSALGHYRFRFEDSVHPMFNVKRRPFSLWLGSWWLQEATTGFGIVPGGMIPFVNVPEDPVAQEPAAAAVEAVPPKSRPSRPSLSKAPPPPPPALLERKR